MNEPQLDLRDGAAVRAWWRRARIDAAITATSPEADDFARFGRGSYLAFPQGVLNGTHRIALGANCVINEHAALSAGFPSQAGKGPPAIVLGDSVVLGRRTELLAMERIEIGNNVQFGSGCLVVDHNHVDHDPHEPIALQLPLQVGPVGIGAGSWIGAGTTILAGAQIGEHTRVAAGAVVARGRYPSGALLAGIPATHQRSRHPHRS